MILFKSRSGELVKNPTSHIKLKYKKDSIFDNSIICAILMVLCFLVDISLFVSLCMNVLYSSIPVLIISVSGFIFAIDVIPLYLGLVFKRQEQGLDKSNKLIQGLTLGVCVFAIVLNMILRVITIYEIPTRTDANQDSGFYTSQVVEQEEVEEETKAPTPGQILETAIGMFVPVFSSVGLFYISFVTSDSLQERKKNSEIAFLTESEKLRQDKALLNEYEYYQNYFEYINKNDEKKFLAQQQHYKALLVEYIEHVKLRLAQEFSDPVATSSITEEDYLELNQKLNKLM